MQDRSIESNPEFRVGQRVHSAGDPRRTGTVKYVGPIQGYSGAWVGVDWDSGDAKHDGSVNGFRYFRAQSDRSGSFVRAHSLSPGISLIEALQLRYRGHSTKEEEGMLWFSFVCLFAERTVEKKGR
jgi:dynactin complex subunit